MAQTILHIVAFGINGLMAGGNKNINY
jgi:hypothetical protein